MTSRPVIVFAVALLASPAFAQQQAPPPHPKGSMQRAGAPMKPRSGAILEFDEAMLRLWEDHIMYTRNYIISALGNLEDTDQVAQRLMKNQEDIGNAIKPYYGEDAGIKLTSLLKDHISVATEVVKAAKDGNQDQLKTAQDKWSANGKAIAAFLSGANPRWSKASLEAMLQRHLDLTTQEVTSRLKKDWAADVKAYDQGHEHMIMFAETLSAGIVRQFPDKFRSENVAQSKD